MYLHFELLNMLGGFFLYVAFGICCGLVGMVESIKDRDLYGFTAALTVFTVVHVAGYLLWTS